MFSQTEKEILQIVKRDGSGWDKYIRMALGLKTNRVIVKLLRKGFLDGNAYFFYITPEGAALV